MLNHVSTSSLANLSKHRNPVCAEHVSLCQVSPLRPFFLILATFLFPKLDYFLLVTVQMLNLAPEPVLPPSLSFLPSAAGPQLSNLPFLSRRSLNFPPRVPVVSLVTVDNSLPRMPCDFLPPCFHLVHTHSFSGIFPLPHPLYSNGIYLYFRRSPDCASRPNTFLSQYRVNHFHPSPEDIILQGDVPVLATFWKIDPTVVFGVIWREGD